MARKSEEGPRGWIFLLLSFPPVDVSITQLDMVPPQIGSLCTPFAFLSSLHVHQAINRNQVDEYHNCMARRPTGPLIDAKNPETRRRRTRTTPRTARAPRQPSLTPATFGESPSIYSTNAPCDHDIRCYFHEIPASPVGNKALRKQNDGTRIIFI